jgi:hypothetical protein
MALVNVESVSKKAGGLYLVLSHNIVQYSSKRFGPTLAGHLLELVNFAGIWLETL